MRRDGLTRRQQSVLRKQDWAEQRRLLQEQWRQEREAKHSSPIPPFPTSEPLPNARGRARNQSSSRVIGVYLRADTLARLKDWRPLLNVSQICNAALNREMDKLEDLEDAKRLMREWRNLQAHEREEEP